MVGSSSVAASSSAAAELSAAAGSSTAAGSSADAGSPAAAESSFVQQLAQQHATQQAGSSFPAGISPYPLDGSAVSGEAEKDELAAAPSAQ